MTHHGVSPTHVCASAQNLILGPHTNESHAGIAPLCYQRSCDKIRTFYLICNDLWALCNKIPTKFCQKNLFFFRGRVRPLSCNFLTESACMKASPFLDLFTRVQVKCACLVCACMHKFVHVTCTVQFCPIEGVLWDIIYTYKNKSFIETCRHMPLSPTPTMAKNL